LIGKASDDTEVVKFLRACKFKKPPKAARNQTRAYLTGHALGIEVTFEDEAELDDLPEEFDEGTLVVFNIRMYGGEDENYSKFDGELPYGLNFDMDFKKVRVLLKKPAFKGKEMPTARWDYDGYCLFIRFDRKWEQIRAVSVQLPPVE
jgi:hypothetical protein